MGQAIITDVASGALTAGGVVALAAGPGSTLTVRAYNPPASAKLVKAWADCAEAAYFRVRSPSLSDDTQGIRYALGAGIVDDVIAGPPYQRLLAQDTLTVEASGAAADNIAVALTTLYDDLPGAQMRLHMPGDISGITNFVTTWEVNAAASATVGAFGSTLVTNLYDVSKPDTDYAILGYVTDTQVAAVGVNGAATSNYNLAGPGITDPYKTKRYFADLSLELGVPAIPVFNTASKTAFSVVAADIAASTAANVTLIVAILSQKVTP